ncbi:MAG TPA: EAL domain-containing protein [Noviherbaspirillum sp.]|uniref:EAL domain-containing protein n=1 Tax=Noviherbaspirillum sp. TaxID=1926288 RepID=UPI002D702577|nr:EAL domain-containing protein [Noviherbaspirillum sp.]HYD96535.1 EAL domain-containing protein [Noviherbaspirillum sp.]
MTKEVAPRETYLTRIRLPRPTSISHKVAAVLVLILLVAVSNVFVVRTILEEFHGVASTINVAGRLRYLSQQIALSTVTALNGWSPGKAAAEAEIHEYEVALESLMRGGRVHGFDVRTVAMDYYLELDVIRRDWAVFRKEIEDALAQPSDPSESLVSAVQLGKINEASGRMLMNAERLMQSMTVDAQRRQERALNATYLLLLVDVLVLAGVAVLVRRQVVWPLRTLAQQSRNLADGNYEVQVHYPYKDEIGVLAETFNYSAQRIGNLVGNIEQERRNLAQAEGMFRGLAENSVVGVYIAQDGRFHFANAKMAHMFGYTPEEMTGSVSVLDLVPEDDRLLVEMNVERRLRGDARGVHYERRARRRDGAIFDVEVFGSTMELNSRTATIGIMLDITERKKAETSMQLAAMVYAHSSEGMTITDANGFIVDVNPAFTKITGYPREEAVGRRISMLRSGRHDRAFYEDMWHALTTTGQWQGEIWNRRKSGELYAEWLTINTSYTPDGLVYRRIALFSDITQKKKTDELVWTQANFDTLTQLPNRLMFRDRLEQEIRKAHRAGLSMALMFIDLDRFKEVNDTLGHGVGDILLKQAALRLTNCVRESDTVARLGGDEFTMILGELSSEADAERIAQDVLNRLAEPFVLGEEIAYVSASVGITFYPQDGTEADDLLKNADQAMYAAKEEGRNRYHYFTPSMQEKAQMRRRLASDLHKAVTHRQLRVYYQPIVDLRTGKIRKAEALVRWQHPVRGLVSPADFIPIAEDTGQIVEIGNWVFYEAAQQLAKWRQVIPDFQISVNTSPAQYRKGRVGHESWFERVDNLDFPLGGIIVEITESLLLETTDAIKAQLQGLRDAGIKVSLDDFGTGYSSLSYLSRIDIDYLKIDRAFATGLSEGSENMVLYEAMIVMAHKLGIEVVAEGVETEEQRRLLEKMGCDYVQGFLFSRPIPAEQFEQFIHAEQQA